MGEGVGGGGVGGGTLLGHTESHQCSYWNGIMPSRLSEASEELTGTACVKEEVGDLGSCS